MWDDDYNPKMRIEFSYVDYDKDGNEVARVVRSLHGENAEYLPNILREFHYFLQGMSYTYVENVVANHTGGGESRSDEV